MRPLCRFALAKEGKDTKTAQRHRLVKSWRLEDTLRLHRQRAQAAATAAALGMQLLQEATAFRGKANFLTSLQSFAIARSNLAREAMVVVVAEWSSTTSREEALAAARASEEVAIMVLALMVSFMSNGTHPQSNTSTKRLRAMVLSFALRHFNQRRSPSNRVRCSLSRARRWSRWCVC